MEYIWFLYALEHLMRFPNALLEISDQVMPELTDGFDLAPESGMHRIELSGGDAEFALERLFEHINFRLGL
jgi:hypothetical protein